MRPPKILAVIDTPDVAVGAVDPLKRRVTTATRFSSRAGADRRIFVSTYTERQKRRASPTSSLADESEPETPVSETHGDVEVSAGVQPIAGAWAELADGPPPMGAPGALAKMATLPPDFKGLATPGLNPMSMALSHEEIVVGCADGTIYVMSFVGWLYGMKGENAAEEAEVESDGMEGEY